MRVFLAAQVFSRTVAAAIETAVQSNKFKRNSNITALATAAFIRKVDKVFDCLNSGVLKDSNLYKSALKKDNIVYNYIKEFISYIKNVTPIPEKHKVFCIDGIKQTLKASLLLIEDISNNYDQYHADFLLTKRLNQDILENLFGVLRAKGGHNKNPSIHELNTLLGKVLSTNMLHFTTYTNCQQDENYSLELDLNEISENLLETPHDSKDNDESTNL